MMEDSSGDESFSSCAICTGDSDLVEGSRNDKLAFGLFCKLLNIRSNSTDEIDELCKFVDEYYTKYNKSHNSDINGTSAGFDDRRGESMSVCEICSESLLEIFRLEQVIHDLKVSQMVHVKMLQRSLKLETKSQHFINEKLTYWETIRHQLITCLQKKAAPEKIRRGQVRKRKAVAVEAQPNSSVGSFPETDPTVCKPCSVKLVRLNLETLESYGVRTNAQGENDLTTNQNLDSDLDPFIDDEYYSSANKDHHFRQRKEKSSPKSNDFSSNRNPDNCPNEIKEEPVDGELESFEELHMDFQSKINESDRRKIHTDDDYESKQLVQLESSTAASIKDERYKYVHLIAENVYMYRSSVIKFLPKDRLFTCIEPNCGDIIEGTLLDCSILRNIISHVLAKHIEDIISSDMRQCPLCPSKLEIPKKFYRKHLSSHVMFNLKTKKIYNEGCIICDICGRPILTQANLHRWAHRSFSDSLAAIHAGETLPNKLKKKLKKKKDHLYSLALAVERKQQQQLSVNVTKKTSGDSSTVRNRSKKTSSEVSKRNRKQLKSDEIVKSQAGMKKIPSRYAASPFFNCLYFVNETTILYKCTVVSVVNNTGKLTCKEPGCDESFTGEALMDYYELLEKVKSHIDACHEAYYQNPVDVEGSVSRRACPLCNETFHFGLTFRHHFFDNHCVTVEDKCKKGIGRILCQICWMPFRKEIYYMKYHLWTHKSTEEQAQTKVSKTILEKQKGQLWPCKTCGKMFTSLERLKVHQTVHLDYEKRRKWKCTYCNKLFLAAVAVRNHVERTHRPDLKQFSVCPEPGCGKVFYRRDFHKFKCHKLMHVNKRERSCVCHLCGSSFYNNAGLDKHINTVHSSMRRYQCDECEESYKHASHLNRHKRNKHSQK